MNRLAYLCVFAIWSIAGSALAADPPADEEEQPQTIKLTLHPATEPRPALKYQLLPPVTERRPGNAALVYPKCRLERGSAAFKTIEEARGKIDDWLDLPLGELPLDEVRKTLQQMTSQLNCAEDGARRDDYASDIPVHQGFSIMTLLPQVNLPRELAKMNAMQARLQVADAKFDEAVHSLQTGFSLGRQSAGEPALVCGLIAMSIEQVTCGAVDDFVSQANSPNLYWALSALPRPFIDLHPAWDLEYSLIDLSYPQLKELEARPFSVEEMRALAKNWARDMQMLGSGDGGLGRGAEFDAGLAMLSIKAYPAAKRYLVEHGRTMKDVEAMPVLQVVTLHTLANFRDLRDKQFRWLPLPYAEAAEFLRREQQRFQEEAPGQEIIPLAQLYLPAFRMLYSAGARSERRIAALRLIEALRLYAADHEGRLPSKLSDITAVPVPIDPVTGRVFEYTQSGDLATINSPPVLERSMNSALRYEIKMLPK